MASSPPLDQAHAFYRSLVERAGLDVLDSAVPEVLNFSLQNCRFEIHLESPHFLRISTCFRSAPANPRVPSNSFAGLLDFPRFLAVANELNLQMGGIVKTVVRHDSVCFEASCFLFGAILPARMGALSLPLLTLAQIEPILQESLVALSWVTAEFFRKVERLSSAASELPSLGLAVAPNPEGPSYFERMLAELALRVGNAGTGEQPSLVFDLQGFLGQLKLSAKDGWHTLISMPFIDQRLFKPGQTAANVAHAHIDEQFFPQCNQFNGQHAGFKCGVLPRQGTVLVLAPAIIPQLRRADARTQMQTFLNLLVEQAKNLFADAGVRISGMQTMTQRSVAATQS